MGDGIQVEIADPVALIRLDRPEKLNALTYPMLGAIRRAVDAAAADPAVVGIVITGSGRGFCSGLDSEALVATTQGRAPRGNSATSAEVPGLFTYLLDVPKPVIALVAVLIGPVAVSVARADTYRMVDGAGRVHLTNAPADPRYRGLLIVSGTATGWLRRPEEFD